MDEDERRFGELWRHREDVLYPAMFGRPRPGIYVPGPGAFERQGATFMDPRWFTYGIHAYPRTRDRATVVYASHGLSLPWDDYGFADWEPAGISGLGYEIVLEVGRQSQWALDLALDVLVYAILIGWDALHGPAPEPALHHGSRMSWGVPVNGSPRCRLRNLIALTPPRLAKGFSTESGSVETLQIACVSDAEIAYARREGSQALIDLLVAHDAVTIAPGREDVPLPP